MLTDDQTIQTVYFFVIVATDSTEVSLLEPFVAFLECFVPLAPAVSKGSNEQLLRANMVTVKEHTFVYVGTSLDRAGQLNASNAQLRHTTWRRPSSPCC